MSRQPVQFTVRTHWWNLLWKKFSDKWGECDTENQSIHVDYRARGKDELGTVIHEFTHAFFPDLNEDTVLQFDDELTRLLLLLGYERKPTEG